MIFTVDDGHVRDVEHGLRPPMPQVITIPIVAQMGARGAEVVVYICTPAFGQHGIPTTDRELKAIAAEIAKRLA